MRSYVKSSYPCHQISAFTSPQALRPHRRTPSPPSTRPASPWSGRRPGTPGAEATSPTACTAESAPATAGSACRAAAASTLCPDSTASRRPWCWSRTCSRTLTTASLSRARTECLTWVLHPGARSSLTSRHHRQVRAFCIHTSSHAFRIFISISSRILHSSSDQSHLNKTKNTQIKAWLHPRCSSSCELLQFDLSVRGKEGFFFCT